MEEFGWYWIGEFGKPGSLESIYEKKKLVKNIWISLKLKLIYKQINILSLFTALSLEMEIENLENHLDLKIIPN